MSGTRTVTCATRLSSPARSRVPVSASRSPATPPPNKRSAPRSPALSPLTFKRSAADFRERCPYTFDQACQQLFLFNKNGWRLNDDLNGFVHWVKNAFENGELDEMEKTTLASTGHFSDGFFTKPKNDVIVID